MTTMEQLPPEYLAAFKDADIRGVYPSEIDETLVHRIGYWLGSEWKLSEIVVARDMRLSSPVLHEALCLGLRQAGVKVHDLGLVSTPVLYFASGEWEMWGVMLTASHNPADYNGLKIVRPGAVPMTNATGLRTVKRLVKTAVPPDAKKQAPLKKRSLTLAYCNVMRRVVPLAQKPTVRVLADAGNGMGATVLEKVASQSGLTVKTINQTLDGSFPARASNPMLKKNQRPIKKELKEKAYDLGIAFDGDGDRVAFFTPQGTMLNGAVVGAVIAAEILRDQPGATCIDTVFTSRVYPETVRAAGGKLKRARVGHSYIKEQMRKHDAVFACEHSGHYYFRDNCYADSSLLALFYFVRALQAAEGDLKRLLRPYQRYHQTEEILIAVTDKKAVLTAVAEHYQTKVDTKVKLFDGVTVDRGTCWFTVKPSVTEDALKFVVESENKAEAETTQKEVQAFLDQFRRQ